MKRIIYLTILAFLVGCATVKVTSYIKDENPYKQSFYSDFDTVVNATYDVLYGMGWQVEKAVDPTLYEYNKEIEERGAKQILLLTRERNTRFSFEKRNSRINIFLRTVEENTTEVEIRILTITTLLLKTFENYENDDLAEKIFKKIEQLLI